MIDHPDILLGRSLAARTLDREVTAAAHSDAKVLLTGESGVGKEVSARFIHQRSARRDGAFVALNCAGVPDSLLESELFGHVRGAFTDAYRDKTGLLEAASGGTVFLDEVGEMSLRMQAMLLRFLETGEIQRVGADRATGRLNVRVICATNRSLPERVAEGAFREDLFYRLNVVHIHVPPLRERREDLPEMVEHFRRYYAQRHGLAMPDFDVDVMSHLLAYRWPGNIRELRNAVERLVVRAQNGRVGCADLPAEIREGASVAEHEASVVGPVSPMEALADAAAQEILRQMTVGGASFWHVVHDPFLARNLTRDTVRRIVALGLERTRGRYEQLPVVFNLTTRDHRRLMTFLRKHDCLVSGVGHAGPTAVGDEPVALGRSHAS